MVEHIEKELRARLASTECPFSWMPNRTEFEAVDPQYILRKNIPKDEPTRDNFTNYSKYMRRVFELGNQNDGENAIQSIEEWEEFLSNKITQDKFFEKNSSVMKHVVYSSKAHLLLKMGEYDEAKSLIETIANIDCEDDHLKAAMFGLKAKFFDKYGSQGHQRALPNILEALKLDPLEPEWIYLKAKTLRDIRRGELYNMEGTKESRLEETELFEKVTILKKKGVYFIRLGNSYHDLANYLHYKKEYKNQSEMWNYYDKGVECFKRGIAIDSKKKNYLRVIRGINMIPDYYRKKYKIITKIWIGKILPKGEEEDDDVNYVLGKYYQYIEKDNIEAINYISKAADLGNVCAKKDRLRMIFDVTSPIYDPHKSPEKEIFEIMNTYPDKPKKLECLCQLASYNLFIKNDLLKAKDFVLEVKQNDPGFDSPYLRNHKSWFYNQRRNIDLLNVVFGKVACRLEGISAEDESKEATELREFKNELSGVIPVQK